MILFIYISFLIGLNAFILPEQSTDWEVPESAKEMKGDLGDFSPEEFQEQTDGTLFYKITTGREDMPNFEKKIINEEDRWLIVNYLRTLKE